MISTAQMASPSKDPEDAARAESVDAEKDVAGTKRHGETGEPPLPGVARHEDNS